MKQQRVRGAMALFGEKYGEKVRVLTMGDDDFSVELCGGTHVNRLGDIGRFKIISEGGVASGVRRIEAVTGQEAYRLDKSNENSLDMIAKITKSNSANVLKKIKQLISNQKNLEKQIVSFQKQLASDQVSDLASNIEDINGIKLLATEVSGVS